MSVQLPFLIVSLLSSGIICSAFVWLRKSGEIKSLQEQSRTAELIYQERLQHRDETINELGSRTNKLQEKLIEGAATSAKRRERIVELETRFAALTNHTAEQAEIIKRSRQELSDTFKALSADILKNNNQSFLALAKEAIANLHRRTENELEKRSISIQELFKPVQASLSRVDSQMRQVEKDRIEAYTSLREQITSLVNVQNQLKDETSNLNMALRTPNVRGRWGEIQLRRVVELAGMIEYCDFIEQESVTDGEGYLRPDMVIKLPNKKEIVVDSKAVLQSYLEAQECKDEKKRLSKLAQHAKHVRKQISLLSAKAYWQQFKNSPEFVVLFLPGENFFSAALEQDPELIELGVTQRVIIATPTTLIALLRAVSYGWRHEQLSINAQKIGDLGKTLFERLHIMADHFTDIKKGLDRTVQAFNNTVGSYEGRVMVTACKLAELDTSLEREREPLAMVDKTCRNLNQ